MYSIESDYIYLFIEVFYHLFHFISLLSFNFVVSFDSVKYNFKALIYNTRLTMSTCITMYLIFFLLFISFFKEHIISKKKYTNLTDFVIYKKNEYTFQV